MKVLAKCHNYTGCVRAYRGDKIELRIGDRPIGIECIKDNSGLVVQKHAVIYPDVIELPAITLLPRSVTVRLIRIVYENPGVEILKDYVLKSEELTLVISVYFGNGVYHPFAQTLDAIRACSTARGFAKQRRIAQQLYISDSYCICAAADSEDGLFIVSQTNAGCTFLRR